MGVLPLVTTLEGDLNQLADRFGTLLVEGGVVLRGSVIVLVSMTPDVSPGRSNYLKLQSV